MAALRPVSPSEVDALSEEKLTVAEGRTLPAVALRGLTVFPNMLIHFDVGRESSLKAIEAAVDQGQDIFLVTQKSIMTEQPRQQDLYQIGTICSIRQLLRLPENNVRVMVEGQCRAQLLERPQERPFLTAVVQQIPSEPAGVNTPRCEAVVRQAYEHQLETEQLRVGWEIST